MIKNIAANFIGKFWSILSSFIFIPLYIHFLGLESYSIISFTLVIAGIMAVLDAGLSATLSREFSRLDNSKDEKIRIFKTLESSYFILIGIVIFLVFSLSGILAEKWLNLEAYDSAKVSFYLKIISFDIGFQLLFRFYIGGLMGLEKQVKANMYQMGWGFLRNGCVILVLLFKPTLDLFFVWQTGSTILFALLLKMALEKDLIGHSVFDVRMKIEKDVFERIWKFAGGMFLISFIASINSQMDKLAISKLLSIESLGFYTLSISLAQSILVLVSPITTASLPRFTAMYSKGKNQEASALYHKISIITAIIVFSLMANIVLFPQNLLWIWTGNSVLAEKASVYLPIIAMSIAMLSLATIPYNIAIANGYTKLNNIIGLTSIIVTIPGYWIATTHFGALGAAWVFCIVQTLTTLIYLYFINSKFLKSKKTIYIYIREIVFPMGLSFLITFCFSFMPEWVEKSRLYSLVWIGLSISITIVALTLILLNKKDWMSLLKLKQHTH